MDNRTFTSKLNTLMELWGTVDFVNELNENDKKEKKIKNIFVQIFPNYNEYDKTTPITDYAEITHKIRCRKLSIKIPQIDMFFIDQDKFKYEVISYCTDYIFKEWWELQCKIILE